MELNEKMLKEIVEQVIGSMNSTSLSSDKNQKGVFDTMSEALEAVNKAYIEYKKSGKAGA